MRIRFLACLPMFVVATALSARADVATLTGSQIEDAMLVQEEPNDNWGGRTNFEVGVIGNGRVRTTVMRFDVTDPSLGLFANGAPCHVLGWRGGLQPAQINPGLLLDDGQLVGQVALGHGQCLK